MFKRFKKNTQIKALDFEFVELMKINIGGIEIDLQAVWDSASKSYHYNKE